MRKVNSIIVSSVIAMGAIMPISASAASEGKEHFNVTSEVLSTDLELETGTVVPSGTVALTVSLNNNTDITASATKLCIDNADILVDENGVPIVETGTLLEDSVVSSAMKDDTVVVASATDVQTVGSGELFTIFVEDTPSNVSVFDITNVSVRLDGVNNRNSFYWYRIGDVNDSNSIDSSDASAVLGAIRTYCGSSSGVLPVSVANYNMSTYFPNTHYAEAADTNKNYAITSEDAVNILDFYSCISVGYTPEEAYDELSEEGNYCYELVLVIEA